MSASARRRLALALLLAPLGCESPSSPLGEAPNLAAEPDAGVTEPELGHVASKPPLDSAGPASAPVSPGPAPSKPRLPRKVDVGACRLPLLVRTATSVLGWPGGALEGAEHLEPFHLALERTRSGGQARVSVWGGSLIAADGIVSVLRESLQCGFGNAGTGYLLADLMATPGSRARTGRATPEAETFNIGIGPRSPVGVGISGVVHRLEAPSSLQFPVREATRARVWVRSSSGRFRYRSARARLQPLPETQPATVDIAPGAEQFELRLLRGRAVVDGVEFLSKRPGVVVDTFGVPAADPRRFSKTDPELFGAQLAAMGPDLAVLIMGGNEVGDLRRHRTDEERLTAELRALLARLASVPACLVVGPIEKIRLEGSRRFRTSPAVEPVNQLQREAAEAAGCAFFDVYAAMGGEGAIRALARKGWMHPDLIHPKRAGLDLIGALLTQALLEPWSAP